MLPVELQPMLSGSSRNATRVEETPSILPVENHELWVGQNYDPTTALLSGFTKEATQPANLPEGSAVAGKSLRQHKAQPLMRLSEIKPNVLTDMIDDHLRPTEEELKTLPRVADEIPWRVYTVAFVELCERFSYYGTQILFQNFIQRRLLTPTGRAPNPGGDTDNNPGALGQGQQIATSLGTFFSFWCYALPLLGAWMADTYLGRYKTIMISIACAIVGHVILTVSAAPSVLENTHGALIAFIVAIIIFGLGTGGFKPNISPLIAEQIVGEHLRVSTNKRGERVIVDPAQTSARIYNWFYLFINIGALTGQLSMSYAALYVGYYLAFLLPTLMFLLCPIVLIAFKKNYRLTAPQGSVLGPAIKLLWHATKGRWSLNPVRTVKNLRRASFWDDVKPSHIPPSRRPEWMTFDDAWVDEMRRGFKACSVFLWYPLYWIASNQINNNLTSQADTMRHAGLPPEIVSNMDPLALIILIPICDLGIYPALRRAGIQFTPIKKITLGFWTAAAAMVYASVLQNYIYNHNDCGRYPSAGLPDGTDCPPARISIWAQTGIYVLVAISEILASITSLEYAFTKAPKNMRSMVQAFALFMTAVANAIGEGLIALSTDPLLVWNYASMALITFVAGCLFLVSHRHLDAEEDALNQLPAGQVGRGRAAALQPLGGGRLSRTASVSNLSEASAGSEDRMLADKE
ncbi:POT family proton-dependent oligopeptide transporter [Capronia coronata CBS 617.96]|uniref:POT family proton-dependent oligopeptide transporter n=1 Tax=Capronia coronata CBS 617.96 TaxID=1182541 RepID=W9XTZ7_9EURO|nr:POT family proton-dependent oligopeptide transporter [Capronia coronata CBS 617.96]EXJ83708.1 POT family proton-dependent oligopeptide transporter [Capronia coronata CBS 617.96]